MEKLYIIECGVKRKAEKYICEFCGKEFLRVTHKKNKYKYCSRKCYNSTKNKKIEFECFNCKKVFYRAPNKLKNSKHGFYFCSRKCKEESQSLKGNCPEIRPEHFGTAVGRTYCRRFADELKTKCNSCGENKKYLLVLHHKDGNPMNNPEDQSNWEILCHNCHVKRHFKKINGEWTYTTDAITPREMLGEL